MTDQIDKKLIGLLRKDGRITSKEAAAKLGISRVAVQQRISKLCGEGIIHITVFVNPTKSDAPLGVIIGLDVINSDIDNIIHMLLKQQCVARVTKTMGRFNIFLYTAFLDINDMSSFFLNVLSPMPGIRKNEGFILLHNDQNNYVAPEIDPLDKDIIGLLKEDGRRSNVSIAKRLGASTSTVHRRIRKLQSDDRIRIVALVNQKKVDWYWPAALAVSVQSPYLLQVRNSLASHPNIFFVFCTTGRYDLIVSLECVSREQMFHIVEGELAKIKGVKDYELFISEGGSSPEYYGPQWRTKDS